MPEVVYEGVDGITREEYERENIQFNQKIGHWELTVGEDELGNERLKRIPREWVYSVTMTASESGVSAVAKRFIPYLE